MKFRTPRGDVEFAIDDRWWQFAEMDAFLNRRIGDYFPIPVGSAKSACVVEAFDVEPPARSAGVDSLKKYKLVPLLCALQSPECALPPISVARNSAGAPYAYRVTNGFHRFYASVAVGYPKIPVVIDPNAP